MRISETSALLAFARKTVALAASSPDVALELIKDVRDSYRQEPRDVRVPSRNWHAGSPQHSTRTRQYQE